MTEPTNKGFSGWIVQGCVVLLVAFVLWKIFCTIIKPIHRKWLVSAIDGFQQVINVRMRARKTALLADGLKQMTVNAGRNLHVLEIGSGSGANFYYYPEGTVVNCIDPEPFYDDLLRKNAGQYPHVQLGEFHVGMAEDMSTVGSNSVDAVVCTFVLCSVQDVDKCLGEIRRVLKPGGKFFFLEHIEAEKGTTIYLIQHVVKRLWAVVIGECQLTRTTHENIHRAGFSEVQCEVFVANELLNPPRAFFGMLPLLKTQAIGSCTK